MPEPGRLIAAGRDADIYEFGPGRVLRRARSGRSMADEARVLDWAADHGFPVPRVEEVRAGGTEIVMERVDGPLMMDDLGRRPQAAFAQAELLGDLHDRLHEIPAAPWLSRHPDGGDRLVHLDLHPLNVIMAARGPVVIDWSNACGGEPLLDVGFTSVLLTCPDAPLPRALQLAAWPLRRAMARRFARRYRGPELRRWTARAARLKTADPHLSPAEVARCRRLAERLEHR